MQNHLNSEKQQRKTIQNIEQETSEKNEKEKIQKIISLDIDPLKIVILGDSKVGKTNFIRKLSNKPFQLEYTQTQIKNQ